MSDDTTDTGDDPGSDDAEDGPSHRFPAWVPAVLRGGATIVFAGILLAVALALTDTDDSGTADLRGSAADLAAVDSTATTAAPPPTTAPAPTTTAEPAPETTPAAPSPPTAPPPDAPEPVDERCPSYTVDEEFAVSICDRGALVAQVQTALTTAGFPVEVNGFFTAATEEAVIQFQAREGLEQDGLVGPETGAALGIG